MKSIALYSIKGGVGKTAACVNLAHLATENRGPVLLCDMGFYRAPLTYRRPHTQAAAAFNKLWSEIETRVFYR